MEKNEDITKRLDALLAILLNKESSSMLEKVKLLKETGLDYKEIARIIGTTPNSVSVMFAKLNKKDKPVRENKIQDGQESI